MTTPRMRRILDDCRRDAEQLLDEVERVARPRPQRSPLLPPRPYVSPRAHRRLRRLTIALALLIAIPVASVVTVFVGLNPFVRSQVESLASSALKVPVVMDRARVNIAGGVRFFRLAVGNPLPFKEVRAFRVDAVAAEMSLVSASKNTIEINEVVILHPRMIVEAGKEKLNWSVLMDHLQKPAGKPEAAEKAPRGEKKFIIHRLRIVRPVVVIRSPKMSQGGAEIVLRDIELQGIGTGPGRAATLSLVLATVFQSLLTGAIDEWAGLPEDLGLGEITSSTSKSYRDELKKAE